MFQITRRRGFEIDDRVSLFGVLGETSDARRYTIYKKNLNL
jgi:hypothetical protein